MSNLSRKLPLAAGIVLAAVILGPSAALAHHSYAMFDNAATQTVRGTVARLEWRNPHVFLWLYVRKPGGARGYDLWAFENGSPSGLSARGWSRGTFAAGEQITVEYWPLRSGENGGHVERVIWSDGRTLDGAGGPGRF